MKNYSWKTELLARFIAFSSYMSICIGVLFLTMSHVWAGMLLLFIGSALLITPSFYWWQNFLHDRKLNSIKKYQENLGRYRLLKAIGEQRYFTYKEAAEYDQLIRAIRIFEAKFFPYYNPYRDNAEQSKPPFYVESKPAPEDTN